MNEPKKELHIIIERQTANKFLTKCKSEGTNGSKKIKQWITSFLMGELQ